MVITNFGKRQLQSVAAGVVFLAGMSGSLAAQNNVTGVNDLSNLQHQRLTGTGNVNGSTTNPNTNGNDMTPSLMDMGFGTDMANQGPFVTMSDKQFAQGVAMRGMIAMELGRVATERGSTPEIKALGQMMVDDYARWTSGMNRASAALGIKLPVAMDAKNKALVANIEGLSGPQFDSAFLKEIMALDNKAMTVAEYEASNAGVSGFRHWAGVMVTHIQDELKMARQTMSSTAVISKK